jgi:hypothetical protein
VHAATASHAAGQTQAFTVRGSFGVGPHTVTIDFLNDAYAGTASTDRNIWVDSVTNAGLVTRLDTPIYSQGPFSFNVPAPVTVLTGSNITGPASGNALLNGTPGDGVIIAHGADNSINGLGGNDTVAGGEAGGDTIAVGTPGDGLTTLKATIGITGPSNTVLAGDEAVSLSGVATGTSATLGNGAETVSLSGSGNSVMVGYGPNSLSLLGGNATINIISSSPPLGGYTDDILLSGDHNTVPVSLLAAKHVKRVVQTVERPVLLPTAKVVVHRAAWRQIFRDRAPLAAGAQQIHQTVKHLAHIDGPLIAASLGTRDLRFGQ